MTASLRFKQPRNTTHASQTRAINQLSRSMNQQNSEILDAIGASVTTKVYQTANVAFVNSAFTEFSWDGEVSDNLAWHSTTTNPERVTVSKAGLFAVNFLVTYEALALTTPMYRLKKNGTVISTLEYPSASTPLGLVIGQTGSLVVSLASGDYLSLEMRHMTAASRTVQGGSDLTWFAVSYLGS